jgi:cell fate regulator YaaT (PSP1 superfamily)
MTQQAEPVQDDTPSPPLPLLVAVRFGYLGWTGEFRHEPGLKLRWSDRVVVKTERGLEIGTPVAACSSQVCPKCVRPEQQQAYVLASGEEYMQKGSGEIVRVTSPEDLLEQHRLDSQAKEKLDFCQKASAKAGLDMQMVACEHLLGGERIIFYFTAEGRIDFRQLVRDLAREYHTRIEMRQIGARDEARIVADLEICGRECCCKNFLKVLRPVNMKMAKLQKATLDPTKVSGRCGRLRCCLRYEQETYEELDAKLPQVGLWARVENGMGVIRERQVISQIVMLDMGEGRRLAVPLEEVKEILTPAEAAALQDRGNISRRRSESDVAKPQGNGRTGTPPIQVVGAAPQAAAAEVPENGSQDEPPQPSHNREPRAEGMGQQARRSGRGGRRGEGRGPGGRGEPRPGRNDEGRGQPRPAAPAGSTGPDNSPSPREQVDDTTPSPGQEANAGSPPGDSPPVNPERPSGAANVPGAGRPRRRRRRGRRGPREGQPPRSDGNPPPSQ